MSQWITVCQLDDILPETGVCALVGHEHVAVFRPYNSDEIYAISNIDPFAQASVLSRGIIGQHENDLYVASPLKKQRFRLKDGYCIDDADYSIAHYEVRVNTDGFVEVKSSS
ncbi:nitrite reductase small subunit NirD [Gilliamella sp. ESL0441]|uniref:nitrite reductase small subunit NirD n=1 Tax=unclassified Gilliamella TaxID=2685620 RepID=UPI001C696449|nr:MULTISPECIES: nitrite reductase small subunit NirD [unclassified Gilliamella]MCX8574220.1 nitrite reductase small subunit NirD [Gilliamella sp. B3831]MCX8576451.1 nitrite reductase small subunit NirD [Gilliamella sp. B3815]MCX8590952.1 nitrite reductase small subunit NirD [Gilliamella sp. B3812]MCX8603662.1 nitrite reductase small subunit NirD [Gilliamella sp. B3823]MCX8606054.1 nitrite reductase small subunit NirD [Gilliamella sp. B3825]